MVDTEAPPETALGFSLSPLFEKHVIELDGARRARRAALQLRSVAEQRTPVAAAATTGLGEVLPTDEFEGDAALRTLNKLLSMVDDRGYQRSSQQLKFHHAFTRSTSRVIYRADWSKSQPKIMEKNNWDSTPSEILISTPRRFGKTFS